jgi:hypothetical protein
MTLKTYHNIEEHFDNIDASIFNGDLLYDAEAVSEIEHYLQRWTRAIAEHKEFMMEQAEEAEYDAQRKAEEEKANCDFSVYHVPSGNTRYEMFNSTHDNVFAFDGRLISSRTLQETAEFLIRQWNIQSPDHKYTLERSWWNGER